MNNSNNKRYKFSVTKNGPVTGNRVIWSNCIVCEKDLYSDEIDYVVAGPGQFNQNESTCVCSRECADFLIMQSI